MCPDMPDTTSRGAGSAASSPDLAAVVRAFIVKARDEHGLGRFFPDELPLLDEMARLASLEGVGERSSPASSRDASGAASRRAPAPSNDDKTSGGDPDAVRPSEPRAGSQAGLSGPSGSPTSPPERVLVVIALTTTNVQAAVEERLRSALLLGGPSCEAQVYAKRVDELVAADLDALAVTLGGWQAVSRLRVGAVAAGGFGTPLAGAASGDGAGPLAADDPDTTGCPTCGGDGLDDDFHDCPQCDGSGTVPVEPEVERGY